MAASRNRGRWARYLLRSGRDCWSSLRLGRKAEHDRLLLELNREFIFYRGHYDVAQSDQFGSVGITQIYQREGVAGGDPCAAHRGALVKAGLLDQPRGGELCVAFSCTVLRNVFGTASGCLRDFWNHG